MTPAKFVKKVKNYLFVHSISAGLFNSWSDEKFLKMLFKRSMGYELDLNNPKTFSEKLQWIKLHDRKPLYTTLVDKYEVKKYVADRIGEEYVIPTLGVWDSVDEIDFDSLPEQFVLKCTHDSGGVIICRDKAKLDIAAAKKKLRKRLKVNFYYMGREWPYKNVKPRIIAEQYMEDESGYELKDYKFWCFDGEPKVMFIVKGRSDPENGARMNYYDMEFNQLPFRNGFPNYSDPQSCPESFEQMKELAAVLSQGLTHVRIDFYSIHGKIYFGEYTFFDGGGLEPFEPEEWNYTIGQMINLPEKTE